ncbi:rod shape-determining protein MreC [Pikeienuella piscinae]|uniref:Cell shape-determining protein MreC n=1 Tax=Pikeienuella piscinae TaxID=2748098 RepID=A0A7L5BSI4_9RHOB|nr:rod shape-determining protein MreC [Pikeienuella piscinae]QIE54300.1 rod shape-determining protein MreC [Pikeienuella piscinae]
MAGRERGDIGREFGRLVRRGALLALIFLVIALFVLWRADSPRIERLRMALVDWATPSVELTANPLGAVADMMQDFENFTRVYEQNKTLRAEIQRLRAWRESAQQLERENAQLRALNNLHLAPRIGFVAGEVIADSGSPFAQSALLNIGAADGVLDGAAAVDGEGVVGRVVGVGEHASRILLLTDFNSRVPVKVLPSGRRAVLTGENSDAPRLSFLDTMAGVAPGDRVTTSGDGGVFPPDLPVGVIAVIGDYGARMQISADYERLEFVRVLLYRPSTTIDTPGGLIAPDPQAGAPTVGAVGN